MSVLRLTDVSELYAEQGGGVRTYVRKKLELAESCGVALSVIVPGATNGIEPVGASAIVRVKSPRLPLDPRYHLFTDERALHEAIARTRPDVLEASSPFGGGHFAASYRADVPRVLVMHQDASLAIGHALFDRFVSRERLDGIAHPYFRVLGALAERFDTTVVSGAWLAARFSRFGLPRVVSVPFGIDKSGFGEERFDAALRAHLLTRCEVPQSARLLVAVSRHHPEKRIGTLIEGFDRAVRTLGEGSLGLVIFGDGPLASCVRARAARSPGVHVAGYTHDRDELARVLASADLFVHGSAAETYGIVLGEAIASGLPFVAPRFGGAIDLAEDGYASLYEAGDADACARAILEMLGRDRAHLAAALAGARGRVVRDVNDHFLSLFGLYRTLCTTHVSRLSRKAAETVGTSARRGRAGTPRSVL